VVYLQLNSICHGNGCIRSDIWVLYTLWSFSFLQSKNMQLTHDITGTAARWVDPALGFTVSMEYTYH
jgi:hypothetical protein